MKKTILRILSSVFLATSIALGILYIIKYRNYNSMTEFGLNMIDAFSNGVSYSLCLEDAKYGNTTITSCKKYTEQYVDDVESLVDNFSMKIDYDYIGE